MELLCRFNIMVDCTLNWLLAHGWSWTTYFMMFFPSNINLSSSSCSKAFMCVCVCVCVHSSSAKPLSISTLAFSSNMLIWSSLAQWSEHNSGLKLKTWVEYSRCVLQTMQCQLFHGCVCVRPVKSLLTRPYTHIFSFSLDQIQDIFNGRMII